LRIGRHVRAVGEVRRGATAAAGDIAIYGQERNYTTWRLCKMNLAVRGIDADIKWNNEGSFHKDELPDLKFDFILANPPFNISDWGGERLREDGPLEIRHAAAGNANFAWLQHIIHHLAPRGTAGVVLANGSMSSHPVGRRRDPQGADRGRRVDCMVALPGQLFYSTQIPACLWFLARDKSANGHRDRRGEILFIDARKLGHHGRPHPARVLLNLRMNETQEASARALFRDWFVDFGPTRAKAEGRAPYLAPDIWSLFPGTFDDEGKPEGWVWSTIGKEVEAVGGSTPSTKDASLWDGDIAWTTPKDLSGLKSPVLMQTGRTISEAGLQTISSGLLPPGTVLMSSRAPVGYLAITQIPLAINQGYIAMRCNGRVSNWHAYLWAKENINAIVQNANGSTFQEISKANFRPLPFLVGDKDVRDRFNDLVQPMFEQIIANERESRTLAETRDALLPKLMSGEIRVAQAEKLAGDQL
jgi:hypothetical protein